MQEKYQSSDEYSYTLGMSISMELIANHPNLVREVYNSSRMLKNENYDKLVNLCAKYNIPLIEDDHVMDLLSVKENCYVIAVFKKFNGEIKKDHNHLVLVNFDDYGTLGTVFRTAISFDHRDIVLINPLIDYFDPRTVRASMGSIFYTNIQVYASLETYFKDYPNHYRYAIGNDGEELTQATYQKPYTLIYEAHNNLEGINAKHIYLSHHVYEDIPTPMVFGISLHHFYALSKRVR